MSKVVAPLLSFDARGAIAKAQVYSNWRGVQYVRRYVVPANPDTTDQQETRSTFKWLMNTWAYLPADAQAGWNAYASGQPLTGRNAFVKFNLSDLLLEADLTNFIFSPAAKSGPVAAAVSVTPGSEQLSVAVTAPTLPSGWSIDHAVAAAIEQQDPQSGTKHTSYAATDATDPYAPVLTGLTASQAYVVGAWFRYTKADGSKAYGPALMTTGTPTA